MCIEGKSHIYTDYSYIFQSYSALLQSLFTLSRSGFGSGNLHNHNICTSSLYTAQFTYRHEGQVILSFTLYRVERRPIGIYGVNGVSQLASFPGPSV